MQFDSFSSTESLKVATIFMNSINKSSDDYSIVQNNIRKKDLYSSLFNIISPKDFTEYPICFAVPYNHQDLILDKGQVNVLASYIADELLGGSILIIPDNEDDLAQIIVSITRILHSINFESASASLDHAVLELRDS